jgi:hypothetical protein
MPPVMPSRGERSAPSFDPDKPRELSRFFDELERLFANIGTLTDKEKKKEAIRYVDYDVEVVWKILPEYADQTKTYDNFRDAILVHYPDATGDYVYSPNDMERLIGDYQRFGINSDSDLQKFHLKFLAITTWLMEKKMLSDLEQQRAYLRAFQPPLLSAILNRLQMQKPKQHPNIPHRIEVVHEEARYVLHSTNPTVPYNYAAVVQPVVTVQPVPAYSPTSTTVKVETFASVMADFSKTIAEALALGNRSRVSGQSAQRQTDCNFCGGNHFIRECGVVDEYIVAGKVRRNLEGKVVLSTGAFVPRDIPGTLLKERVDEWHHRNPNQLSVASLIHTISAEHIRTHSEHVTTPAFQLSATDRITALEAELFNLRARKSTFAPVIKTRAQHAKEKSQTATIEEVDDIDFDRNAVPFTTVPAPQIQQPSITPELPIITVAPPPVEPTHPYQNAKDATYAPPTDRNVGAQVKVPFTKAAVPAYKSYPPVHEAAIAVDVYKRAMESQVTITQRELLSLSPEIRTQVRDSTTTKRVPTAGISTIQGALQISPQIEEDEEIAFESFALGYQESERVPPAGATIIPDPIEIYLNSLAPGETPHIDRLTVAKESTAIRSVFALVDTSQKKECTVDPGCQVIAMSETTCHSLTLAYDPRIKLHMESANGTFDWSLGLARNVPFLIGTITLYLQVHVIRSPSYEILLGRPFDVLTKSVIRNFTNEDQTITITDPNSGKQCTIPTFARGSHTVRAYEPLDF